MIPVIDLFAGAGGLGEGFSSLHDKSGKPVFQTIMSIECNEQAHRTLLLRSYLRKILNADGCLPDVYLQYMEKQDHETLERLKEYSPSCWKEASREALCRTLVEGDNTYVEEAKNRIESLGNEYKNEPLVIIGGPPCQAYSLVGRSRRAHDEDFDKDVKHTLYKCYLSFIEGLKPDIFVMENVKGLLSAKHNGEGVFRHILDDMDKAGYEIRSLTTHSPERSRDYIVRAELYGIPQRRHRVILIGVKKNSSLNTGLLWKREEIVLGDALAGMPRIRSGFSKRNPNWREMNWANYVDEAARRLESSGKCNELGSVLDTVVSSDLPKNMSENHVADQKGKYDSWYRAHFNGSKLLTDHVARTHLAADLDRYLFCAAYAEVHGEPAKLENFPEALLPNHKNVQNCLQLSRSGGGYEFDDRFRVQLASSPSTTITSHIAKDGHYYIHPDPMQCRSLTVREAARLQTFPDDYFFEGNRTSRYIQVGNAVPPLLAQQIAAVVAKALGKECHGFFEEMKIVGR